MSVLQPLPPVLPFANRRAVPLTNRPPRSRRPLSLLPDRAEDPDGLRKLAAGYREIAERAENPTIWEGRLLTVDAHEREASVLETCQK